MARKLQTTKKIRQQHVNSVTDDMGTVKELTATTVYGIECEPPYIKLYVQDMLYLRDLPREYANVVLALAQFMSYADEDFGCCVALVPAIKQRIIDQLGWTNVRTLNNALTDLVRGDILQRRGRGLYQFNPYLFGRGDWSNIKSMRTSITYTLNGRSFGEVIIEKDKAAKEARASKAVAEAARADTAAPEEPLEGQIDLLGVKEAG